MEIVSFRPQILFGVKLPRFLRQLNCHTTDRNLIPQFKAGEMRFYIWKKFFSQNSCYLLGDCIQRRLRSALASTQSDQSLCCPHEEALCPWLPNERTAKTLIRLGGCPGWSESSLGSVFLLCLISHACWLRWDSQMRACRLTGLLQLVIMYNIQVRHLFSCRSTDMVSL